MSYSSKKNVVSIISGLIIVATYAIYALGNQAPDADNLQAWAQSILIFIGIGVLLTIIIQILFHVFFSIETSYQKKELDGHKLERLIKSEMIEDERDKLISLKSSYIGYICVGAGFLLGLVVLALGAKPLVVLHTLAGSFAGGSIIETAIRIYLNEGDVHHG